MGRQAAGYQSEAKSTTHMRAALGHSVCNQAYATVAPPGSASCGSCYVWGGLALRQRGVMGY